MRVFVRIEKLDRIPGALGVEIARACLENKELDPGNVTRLVMIAPPTHGTMLAHIAVATDVWEQIVQLKAVETEIQTLLKTMDAKRDERMTSLVKTYEAMKPKDAANIFNGMEDGILLDIAKSMKPATLAAIMSTMTPKRAEALTRMLAGLAKPPANIEALQKTPT